MLFLSKIHICSLQKSTVLTLFNVQTCLWIFSNLVSAEAKLPFHFEAVH